MSTNSEICSAPGKSAEPCGGSAKEGFDLWIEAGHTEKHYWIDLWRYRELFFILAWRDVAVRYKQTVAGVGWGVIQPLATMLILTFVFGKVAGMPTIGNAPYEIVVFAAMLPWLFFSAALSAASQSIVSNANMISKVYFPRLIIPASSVLVSLVDFLISLVILGGLMAWFHFWPDWRLLTLPLITLLAILTALGAGLFITALTVRYRDFRFLIPFIVQFGMYVSPVGFDSAEVREKIGEGWFTLYLCNPLVGVIDGFRWAILGGELSFPLQSLLIAFSVSTLLFIGGVAYFRKTERSFADII